MSKKIPAIQLYPGDWLRDDVSGCSLAAQGLWLRCMFVAHDSEQYGYLSVNGLPIPDELLARRCGASVQELQSLLDELFAAGVPRRTRDGIIFSQRMVKDAKTRQDAAKRKAKSRGGGEESHDCHTDVTEMSHATSTSTSTSASATPYPQRGRKSPKGKDVVVDLHDTSAVLKAAKANSEASAFFAVCCAEHACRKGDEPVALFRWLLANREKAELSQADEDAARKRIHEFRKSKANAPKPTE